MRPILICLALAAPGLADTLVLKGGLQIVGDVVENGDRVSVTLDGKTRTFDRARVERIERGTTAREQFEARARALADDDAQGWYRLALWAREKNLAQAGQALEKVLSIEPDHRAARRELGYERVGGEWLTGAEAKRAKGFVLAGGRWMLPEEADRLMRDGLVEQAEVTDEHRQRAEEIAEALMDDDKEVRWAAADMLRELPDAALVRPLKRVLLAPDPAIRELAVKELARIGDRTALPWLIRSSMYDANEDVRAAALRALKLFDDADVFYPYARALFSKSHGARVMAAQALGALGDMRGVGVILHRISIGIGESPRVNIMVGSQLSYIQDFDVEIAQAAAIGDPIVNTIREGVILDFKVLGGHGEALVLEREAYADALRDLTGRDFGQDWAAWARYADEQDFPRTQIR